MPQNTTAMKWSSLALAVAAVLSPLRGAGAQAPDGTGASSYSTQARQTPSRPIALGARVEGFLTGADPKFSDGSHFHVWRFDARAGQNVVATLDSRDYAAFLMVVAAEGETGPARMAAANATTKRARLEVRIPADGAYLIISNTQDAGANGRYQLELSPLADTVAESTSEVLPVRRINVATARPLSLGDSLSADLSRSDGRLSDSSFYDAWRYEGRAGERIVIDHASSDFDAYLILTRQTSDGLVSVLENDDAGGTPNSRVAVELPAAGTYVVVASSLRPRTTGRYTLRLRSMEQACAAGGPCEPSGSPNQRLPFFAAVRGAPSTALALGDSARGRLTAGDRRLSDSTYFNLFRFRANANDEVAIFLSSTELDTYLHLIRADADSLVAIRSDDDGGGGKNSLVTARLTHTGEYMAVANGLSRADTGGYTLNLMRLADACTRRRVCEVGATVTQMAAGETILAAPAQRIALGTPVTARLELGGNKLPDGKPFQPWRYTARAGERIVITNHSSDFDAYLYLYRVDGNTVREIVRDDDGGGSLDAQIAAELGEAGDYLVVAGSFSATATGEYRLTVESMAVACAAGGPCSPGETSAVSGRIRPALTAAYAALPALDTVRAVLPDSAPRIEGRGRFQSYRFRGRANDRIVITMDATSFDPYLHLAFINPPALRLIDSDDDGGQGTNARLVATLPEDGEYLVVASSFFASDTSGFGPYSIRMAPCDSACAAVSDAPATRSEASYRIALRVQRRRLPSGGEVEAELTAADSTLSDGARFHAYWLQGTVGQTLRASLQSTQFDPFLGLFRFENDSLIRVTTDDDSGDGNSSLIEWPVDRAGTYVLVATAYSQASTGRYTLNVEQGPESAHHAFLATVATAAARPLLRQAAAAPHRPLVPGQTVTSEMTDATPHLEGRGRFQSYRFRGRANERVVLTMEAVQFDAFLYLAHVAGQSVRIVGTDDDAGPGSNPRLIATLPATGEYLAIATAYTGADSTGTSRYSIALAPCDDACAAQRTTEGDPSARVLRAPRAPLPLGVPVHAALASTDSTLLDGTHFHAFSLDATAGTRFRALLESEAFDAMLTLYRIEGDSLALVTSDDDGGEGTSALIEWTVDRTASYILVARALTRDTSGAYTLTGSLSPGAGRLH